MGMIVACLHCGKDTKNTSQICSSCSKHFVDNLPSEETGRPMLYNQLQAQLTEYEEYNELNEEDTNEYK